jgi:cobalamin biosynthesis protein CbiG
MRNYLIAGIGCQRNCSAEDILAVIKHACAAAERQVDRLAAPDFKSHEAGLRLAAQRLGLPLILIDTAALSAVQGSCVTRSSRAARVFGVASIAEGCALAVAGANKRLLLPRITYGAATCALAEADAA